jgi:ATP-dependent 26S proteasome regulatory subunit
VIHTEGDPIKREDEETNLADVSYDDIPGTGKMLMAAVANETNTYFHTSGL